MDFPQEEMAQIASLLSHIFFGLHGDNLLEGAWRYGDKENIATIFAAAQEGGIVCQPSALGTEIFLWAFGQADQDVD